MYPSNSCPIFKYHLHSTEYKPCIQIIHVRYLTLTVLRADLNGPNLSYPRVLRAVHIGPNFDVKNKLSTLIYS